MSDHYVIAFVGENANGILRWYTEQILLGLGKFGFDSDLVDLLQPDPIARLNSLLGKRKPTFCFSFQGMGMGIGADGENLWVKGEVPFFTYLGDNPYHWPPLHRVRGPGLYRLNYSADFLSTYTKFFQGGAFSTLYSPDFPENPDAHRTPWAAREYSMVYVKTGVDPEKYRRRWASMPQVLRTIAHDSATTALGGSEDIIADICAKCFEANNLWWGDQKEFFFAICSDVDFYVRAVRAERMVRFVMNQPALIFGDWSHVDQTGARARFCGNTAAANLSALYANTKVLVSTSPSIRHGIHERIMAGMFAKCVVLSDTTPYLSAFFADMPSFVGLNIDDPRFEQQAADTTSLYTNCGDLTAISHSLAQKRLSLDQMVSPMLELLKVERLRRNLSSYRFPA